MALNFDLNLYLLKKHYPSKQYTKAYGDIGQFLKKYEILHRQQSGYVSKDPILMTDLLSIVAQLAQKYFWLTLCAQVFDVTIVAEEYSLLKHITLPIHQLLMKSIDGIKTSFLVNSFLYYTEMTEKTYYSNIQWRLLS